MNERPALVDPDGAAANWTYGPNHDLGPDMEGWRLNDTDLVVGWQADDDRGIWLLLTDTAWGDPAGTVIASYQLLSLAWAEAKLKATLLNAFNGNGTGRQEP